VRRALYRIKVGGVPCRSLKVTFVPLVRGSPVETGPLLSRLACEAGSHPVWHRKHYAQWAARHTLAAKY
jgi:hypothetical protein